MSDRRVRICTPAHDYWVECLEGDSISSEDCWNPMKVQKLGYFIGRMHRRYEWPGFNVEGEHKVPGILRELRLREGYYLNTTMYLYEHSELSVTLTRNSCQWDSSRLGWFITPLNALANLDAFADHMRDLEKDITGSKSRRLYNTLPKIRKFGKMDYYEQFLRESLAELLAEYTNYLNGHGLQLRFKQVERGEAADDTEWEYTHVEYSDTPVASLRNALPDNIKDHAAINELF